MTVVTTTVVTADGLKYTTDVAGDPNAKLVLLLHGFPQSRYIWRHTLGALSDAGYYAAAPDQRGYSPGARPDPADLGNYSYSLLVKDVIDIADCAGARGRKFHLVGHDWGGQVAWGVAARYPERLASLTVVSRPHPAAFRMALLDPDGDQKHRSRHHQAFLAPDTADLLMADGARRLRRMMSSQGAPDAVTDHHMTVIDGRDALEATLAWYRAWLLAAPPIEVGAISVPTLYVWGDADSTVGPKAAYATGDCVSAPYRMEIIPDVGHFVMDEAPEQASLEILSHIERYDTEPVRDA
jgi:pimeloyl-ACP methyl ester carboxylesterase